jgi:hypothetical protein
MSNLTIKNGKFYRGSQEVETVFGDREQIQCLRKYEDLMQSYKKGMELEPEVREITSYCHEISWICVCGRMLEVSETSDDEDDWVTFQSTKVCRCGMGYTIKENEDQDAIIVKSTIPIN